MSASFGASRFGSERWNRLYLEAWPMFVHYKELAEEELTADGPPPFTTETSEADEYHRLVAFAMANDPRYQASEPAKRRLAELALRYGAPPDYPVPYGNKVPMLPGSEAGAFTGAEPGAMLQP